MSDYALSLCDMDYLNSLPDNDFGLSIEEMKKNIQEAYQEGYQEGIQIGNKIRIAKNALNVGISLEIISQAVNIPLDELKEYLNIE
jgi:predicted transposase/invertase (TIGR01784 family)